MYLWAKVSEFGNWNRNSVYVWMRNMYRGEEMTEGIRCNSFRLSELMMEYGRFQAYSFYTADKFHLFSYTHTHTRKLTIPLIDRTVLINQLKIYRANTFMVTISSEECRRESKLGLIFILFPKSCRQEEVYWRAFMRCRPLTVFLKPCNLYRANRTTVVE